MSVALAEAFLTYGVRVAALIFLGWAIFSTIQRFLRSQRDGTLAARGWQYVLARNKVISLEDPSIKAALDSLQTTIAPWEIASRRGAGIGALAGITIGSLFATPLFFFPQTFLADAPWLELTIVMVCVFQVVGGRAGAIINQLRCENRIELVSERSTGYNHLLTGKTSDFRSLVLLTPLTLCWSLTVALVVCAAIGWIPPYLAWEMLPPAQRPLLLILPLASALALTILELLARIRVTARQRVYTYQTTISREVDRYIRAVNTGHIYLAQFNVVAGVLLAQWIILVLLGPPLSRGFSLDLFLAILVICALVARFVNQRVKRAMGQLGGRLTGWPWQKRAAPQTTG